MKTTDLFSLLKQPSIMNIVSCQLDEFRAAYNTSPELVVITVQAKPAFVKELINVLHVGPFEAILEPIWIDGIPVLFKPLGTSFMCLTNRRSKQILTL